MYKNVFAYVKNLNEYVQKFISICMKIYTHTYENLYAYV